MPTYKIRVVNSDFEAEEEVYADDLDNARSQGLRGALGIGTDELCKGRNPFFGAEITVEIDGEVRERFVVGMGQSQLQ